MNKNSLEKEHLMFHKYTHPISDDSGALYTVTGLKTSPVKIILTVLLTICTGGFILLVMHWYPHVKVALTKKKSQLATASYVHVKADDLDIEAVITKVKTSKCGIKYFNFQHLKYIWESGNFLLINGLEKLRYSDIHAMSGGLLTDSESEYRMDRYGLNIINVHVPSYFKLFCKEAIQPFYIFQAGAFILWMWYDYRAYATCILVISIVSIGITIYEQRKQFLKVQAMAASSVDVQVLRNGSEHTILSADLLPGDVILIPRHGMLLCCDAVLVSGGAIVNECALTGESVPATKAPVPYISKYIYDESVEKQNVSEDLVYDPNKDKKYSLYCGTTIIQAKPAIGTSAVAVVTKTGFSTFKGSLIRYIICPKPTSFEFESDARRFLIMLSVFALAGFCYTFYISRKHGDHITETLKLGLDLITTVVPPALPAALTIGVVYAVQRMKKKNIFCIDPQRVNFCGKIQHICFDKTGTLTEDGLSVLGAIPTIDNKMFGTIIKDSAALEENKLLSALASAHELTKINGEIIGDPLDIEMFKYTGWEFEDGNYDDNDVSRLMSAIVKPNKSMQTYADHDLHIETELGIIRSFPFTSELQRMSVVVKDLACDEMTVFCKGAPEMIQSLSLQETVPFNFHSELESYTCEGYRVIAFGWKNLDPEKSWHNIQTMKRSDIECGLNFIGFLVMENHLKEDTADCIKDLVLSNTSVCMVTGDNILTAITVGKKCGIIPSHGTKYDVIVIKMSAESVTFQIDFQDKSAVTLPDNYTQVEIVQVLYKLSQNYHVFAIAEKDYNQVAASHPLIYELLLLKGKIFARMTPGKKQKLVEDYQTLGYTVSMCGDGANDCGALKSAHAGVSLSEAEASIAAPFTSATASISCMIELLRQGRAALVTASVTFRFMAMYSMIQFITQLILYSIGSNMTDYQFLYVDMFVISGIAATLGRSQPAKSLAPSTPKAQLIDLKVFVLLTLHVILTFGFQFSVFMYVKTTPIYVPYVIVGNLHADTSYENTALFIISQNQYVIYGVVLCQGRPFRVPVYRNWTLMTVFIVCTIVSMLFVFQPFPFLSDLMNLVSLQDLTVQVTFLLLMTLNFVMAMLLETMFQNERVTTYLDNVQCMSRKAAEYVKLRALWSALYSDFNAKNLYR